MALLGNRGVRQLNWLRRSIIESFFANQSTSSRLENEALVANGPWPRRGNINSDRPLICCGYNRDMDISIDQIRKLPAAEQLHLAEQIFDELAKSGELVQQWQIDEA